LSEAAICQARSELEAEAAEGDKLRYIGAGAVRGRLDEKEVTFLPSIASIERVLCAAGMTRQQSNSPEEQVTDISPLLWALG
jgi:hypothetical protein